MNQKNFLKSMSKHDEAVLATMTNMINTHPNANIRMASFNVISIEGDGLGDFLQGLVKQVPVLNMKVYKVKPSGTPKQAKHEVVNNGKDIHCIYFTFFELERRERMGIPDNSECGDD